MKLAKKTAVVVTVLIVAILAWSVARAIHRKQSEVTPKSIEQIQMEQGIPVMVSKPFQLDMTDIVQLDGAVVPIETARIMAQTAERVEKIHVDEGDRVEGGANGTLLLELDNATARAMLDAADTAMTDAAKNHERAGKLLEQGGISQQAHEQAALAAKMAAEGAVRAKSAFAHCSVYSPISGYVSKRYVDPGVVTAMGQLLVEVVDVSRLKVEMRVPESRLGLIAVGMKCTVYVGSAGHDASWETTIAAITPALDPVTKHFVAKCTIDEPPDSLKAGMYARVAVEHARYENAVAVPESALVPVKGDTGVFVLDAGGDRARFVTVRPGITQNGLRQIAGGLTGAELVVTEGQNLLSDGALVRVKKPVGQAD